MEQAINIFISKGRDNLSKSALNKQKLLEAILKGLISSSSCKHKDIGFHRSGMVQIESKIKQQQRFLSTDPVLFYKQHMMPLVSSILASLKSRNSRITIVIDSSTVGTGCIAVMLSICINKQAIPLVWDVFDGTKGHLKAAHNIALFDKALEFIGSNAFENVLLLGDGEYSSQEFMAHIISKNCDFVFRASQSDIIYHNDNRFTFKELPLNYQVENVKVNNNSTLLLNAFTLHENKHKKPIHLLSNSLDGFEMKTEYTKRFSIERLFKNIKSNGFIPI